MRAIAVSHRSVRQLTTDGLGGLTRFVRPKKSFEAIEPAPAEIPPLPIEEIIGTQDTPGKLLHNLTHRIKQVTVVVGPTGSGKSTWLPYRLLQCKELVRDGPICITQPRIPATEKVTKRIAELHYGREDLVGPGLDIGYRHSEVGTDKTDRHNKLILMTDGSLLNEIMSGAIRRYSVLIIDEAHERSVNIDLILNLLRHRLSLYPNLRLIIASATVDAERFVKFFGGPEAVLHLDAKGFTYEILDLWGDESVASYGPAEEWQKVASQASVIAPNLRYEPKFEALIHRGPLNLAIKEQLIGLAPGDRTLSEALDQLVADWDPPIQLLDVTRQIRHARWLPAPEPPWQLMHEGEAVLIEACVEKVVRLCNRDEVERFRRLARWERRPQAQYDQPKPKARGDILVFLHGTQAIEEVCRRLRERLIEPTNRVFPFYKDLPENERNLILYPSPKWKNDRLIVVSTNLAETSLTLDGLVYVVESGVIKQDYWDAGNKETRLVNILHSEAGCRQRVGRVGRTQPGEAHRLYTQDQLIRYHPTHTIPAIQRSCADEMVLKLSAAGVSDLGEFQWLDKPQKSELSRSENSLRQGGWIDVQGDLTAKGDELWRLSVDQPSQARLLLEADRFCCLPEAATLIGFVQKLRSGRASLWGSLQGAEAKSEVPPSLLEFHAGSLLFQDEARESALSQCADDADLFLRTWGTWEATSESDREAWAKSFALSIDLLTEVDAAREKILEPFRDKRKGATVRPLLAERLAALRLIAARVFKDWVYVFRPDFGPETLEKHETEDPASQLVDFHAESVGMVWDSPPANIPPPSAFVALSNRSVRLSSLRGFADQNVRGQGRELRHVLRLDPAWLDNLNSDDTSLASLISQSRKLIEPEARLFNSGSMPSLRPPSAQASFNNDDLITFRRCHPVPTEPVKLLVEDVVQMSTGEAWIWKMTEPVTGIRFPIADFDAGGFPSKQAISRFIGRHFPQGSALTLKVSQNCENTWRLRRSFDGVTGSVPGVVLQSNQEGSTIYLGFAQGWLAEPRLTVGHELSVLVVGENPEGHFDLRSPSDSDPWQEVKAQFPAGGAARLPVVAVTDRGLWVAIGSFTSFVATSDSQSVLTKALGVGDRIGLVVEYDDSRRRIKLVPVTDVWAYEDLWDKADKFLAPGTVHTARLVKWLDHGGIVDFGNGIRAWLPANEVDDSTLSRLTECDDSSLMIDVQVETVSVDRRKVTVSQRTLLRARLEQKHPADSTRVGRVSEVRSTGSMVVLLDDGQSVFVSGEERHRSTVDPGDLVQITILGIARTGTSLLGQFEGISRRQEEVLFETHSDITSRPSHFQSTDGLRYLQLDGDNGFRRVYYHDVLLGRGELYGAHPIAQVRELTGTGLRIEFRGGAITVEPLKGIPEVYLNGQLLTLGERATLTLPTNTLTIGQVKLQAYVRDLTLDSRIEPEENEDDLCLHFQTTDGLSRVYYSDIVLNKNELRGAKPSEEVARLRGTGIRFHFGNARIQLSVLPGAPEVFLDEINVNPGERAYLPRGRSTLRIGGLQLSTTVARVWDEIDR